MLRAKRRYSPVSYVAAQLSLLGSAVEPGDREGNPALLALRRAVEADRFGIVAHVLAVRDSCTPDQCSTFGWLRDPSRINVNLAERPFEARLKSASASWPAAGTRGLASNAPSAAPNSSMRAPNNLLPVGSFNPAGQHHDRRAARCPAAVPRYDWHGCFGAVNHADAAAPPAASRCTGTAFAERRRSPCGWRSRGLQAALQDLRSRHRNLSRLRRCSASVSLIDVTKACEAFDHGSEIGSLLLGASCMPQDPDNRRPAGLLRARRERPRGCRTADERYELATFCMTGKEHCEGRRGLGHDRTPVATGSPQAFRTLIRE
jgi:hypothetical protein